MQATNTNHQQEKSPQSLQYLRNLRIFPNLLSQLYLLPFPCTQSRPHQYAFVFQPNDSAWSTFLCLLTAVELKVLSEIQLLTHSLEKLHPTFPMLESAPFLPIPLWYHRHIFIKALVTFHCEHLLMCLSFNPILQGCTSLYLWCMGNSRYGLINKLGLSLMEILREEVQTPRCLAS